MSFVTSFKSANLNFFIGKLTKFVIKSLLKLLLNQTCKTSVFQSHNPKVEGSNPSRATKIKSASVVSKKPTCSGLFCWSSSASRPFVATYGYFQLRLAQCGDQLLAQRGPLVWRRCVRSLPLVAQMFLAPAGTSVHPDRQYKLRRTWAHPPHRYPRASRRRQMQRLVPP